MNTYFVLLLGLLERFSGVEYNSNIKKINTIRMQELVFEFFIILFFYTLHSLLVNLALLALALWHVKKRFCNIFRNKLFWVWQAESKSHVSWRYLSFHVTDATVAHTVSERASEEDSPAEITAPEHYRSFRQKNNKQRDSNMQTVRGSNEVSYHDE